MRRDDWALWGELFSSECVAEAQTHPPSTQHPPLTHARTDRQARGYDRFNVLCPRGGWVSQALLKSAPHVANLVARLGGVSGSHESPSGNSLNGSGIV